MSIQLNLSFEAENSLRQRAVSQGLDVGEYLRRLIEKDVEATASADTRNGDVPKAPATQTAGETPASPAVILPGRCRIIQERPPQPAQSPRGLLPTPPLVEQAVAQEVERFPAMTAKAKQRIRDHFNLQYYFEGQEVVYRHTERGVEVLAVGLREIGELLDRLSPEELLTVIHTQP
jgi:hypothetical protein